MGCMNWSKHMRTAKRICAFLLVATGIVWFFQGINLLPGSFMTGDLRWAWRGAAALIVGAALIALSFRK